MRKLASVQRVQALYPIVNADFIETAQINGWQCIVRKGEFKVGDLGVYFEIDSVPPNWPIFKFLWDPRPEPAPNFRIRTKKLRGVISQGLLLPLRGDLANLATTEAPAEGDDWTDLIGVKKYEVPVKLPGVHVGERPYGAFASDIPKTDEERLQSAGTMLLDELRGLPYVITEKCDGTSATFSVDRDGVFRCYSRNWEQAPPKKATRLSTWLRGVAGRLSRVKWLLRFLPSLALWMRGTAKMQFGTVENVYWAVARKYRIEDALRIHTNCALQGEIVGPNIQKNPMGLGQHELRAFNLYDKNAGVHLSQDQLDRFCQNNASIPQARVLERGDNFQHTQESLLKFAEGKYEGTNNEREGIVVRPLVYRHSRVLGGRLSFKVVSNRYLLKEEE